MPMFVRFGMALFALGVAIAACGTDPAGVESCRKIEEARCRVAPNCNIDMNRPPHSGDTPSDKVESCILWYRDACLHGLVVGDPGAPTVQACVDAINRGDCNVVARPESDPACSWLIPPDQRPPDAGPG